MSEATPESALLGYWQRWVHALDHRAPFRPAQLPSFVPKSFFDLKLVDLPVQMIDPRFRALSRGQALGLIAGSLRRTTTLKDACRTVQQLLLAVVDLVRVDPELPSRLGDSPVAPDGRQRHLRLDAPLRFFRVWFMSCSRAIRAFLGRGSTLATRLIFGVQLN